jgi:hypothetical protein
MRFVFSAMRHIIIPAVLAMLSAVSCVREDLSGCPPVGRETLKVVFSPAPTDLVVGPGFEHRAALYVFDSEGSVFDVWRSDEVVFGETYDTGIVLDDDTYESVAWVSSPDEPYELTPPPEEAAGSGVGISNAELRLPVPSGGTVGEGLPWLFYGAADELTSDVLPNPVEVVLVPDSYVINLSVTGLPSDSGPYRFTITDNNAAYDFRNDWLATEYFTYSTEMQPGTSAGTATLTASLTTLRLGERRSPLIALVNTATGVDIFPADRFGTNDLVRIIRSSRPDCDFETEHIYDIEIAWAGTSVELRVDGWALKPQDIDVTQ